MKKHAFAIVATVAAIATGGATAHAAAPVLIVAPAGSTTIDVAGLAGQYDVQGRQYGVGGGRESATGISLGKLLVGAGFDPRRGYDYVTVTVPGGRQQTLYSDQLFDDTFADGPPVVFPDPDGTGTRFIRPAFGSTPGALVTSDTLTLRLFKGSPLAVTLEASPAKAEPGSAVRFTAQVSGAGDGAQIRYSWRFGDGGTATDSDDGGDVSDNRVERSYTYAKASGCPYKVIVSVSSGAEGAAAPAATAASAKVQVGPRADNQKTCKDDPPQDTGTPADQGGGGTGTPTGTPSSQAALDSILNANAAAVGGDGPASSSPSAAKQDDEPEPRPEKERPDPAPPAPAGPPVRTQAPILGLGGPAVAVRGRVLTEPEKGGAPLVLADVAPVAPPPEKQQHEKHRLLDLHIPPVAWALLALLLVLVAGAWLDTERARAPRPSIPYFQ